MFFILTPNCKATFSPGTMVGIAGSWIGETHKQCQSRLPLISPHNHAIFRGFLTFRLKAKQGRALNERTETDNTCKLDARHEYIKCTRRAEPSFSLAHPIHAAHIGR